jgi:hypothetical protein
MKLGCSTGKPTSDLVGIVVEKPRQGTLCHLPVEEGRSDIEVKFGGQPVAQEFLALADVLG